MKKYHLYLIVTFIWSLQSLRSSIWGVVALCITLLTVAAATGECVTFKCDEIISVISLTHYSWLICIHGHGITFL